MLYNISSAMAGGDSKLSFSVESILRKSSNDSLNSQNQGAANEILQPASTRPSLIMRSRLTRRHYSTSSIETVGLGSGYYPSPMSRGSSSLTTDSEHCYDSPSPLSSPRSVASLPQECLQGIVVSNGLSVMLTRLPAVTLLHWYLICRVTYFQSC